ncbi:Hypothetical predicted protein [Paramuricea clavata]|uniref:Uncharacterized protein n=1 Tax=Paramuricea clavata TaxID=317549 RepID=A0A7D9J1Z3_PARCT|nr:Hypothetical predicted protein [Paramuricea clavata]
MADMAKLKADAMSIVEEEVETNDLTRFERFKKWAKENIFGISAVAISVAAIAAIAVNSGFTPRQILGLLGVMEFGYHLMDNMVAIASMDKPPGPYNHQDT